MRSLAVLVGIALFLPVALAGDTDNTAPATKQAKTRIVLAGDSTVTDHVGWGQGFAKCLAEPVECINLARSGASSKSFIDSGQWKACLDAKPDYLLIQFGHNDEPGKGPQRETDPRTTYRQNIVRFVEEARQAGIQPVLVTSLSRRRWNDKGKIDSSLTPYVAVVKEVAAEKSATLIDLHSRSIELYEKLGEQGCQAISPKMETGYDGTHLNSQGSESLGALVAEEWAKTDRSVAPLFKSSPTPGEEKSQIPSQEPLSLPPS